MVLAKEPKARVGVLMVKGSVTVRAAAAAG